jgi:hypothetical protein
MKLQKLITLVGILLIAGCGEQQPANQAPEEAKVVTAPVVKSHNYSLKEGNEYGYERALTTDETNNGQVAASLLMARFIGTQDGKYQVVVVDNGDTNVVNVVECTNPCEFMKNMVFSQGTLIGSQRIRVAPNVIGWMMLEDAINGHLDQYLKDVNGKKYTMWFDEKNGASETEVPVQK